MESKLTPNFTDPKIIADMLLFCAQQSKELMLPIVLPNQIPPRKTISELLINFCEDAEKVEKILARLESGAYSQELMASLLEALVHMVRACAGTSIIFSLPFNPAWNELQRAGMNLNKEDTPDIWGVVHKVWQQYAVANPPKPMSPPDINGNEGVKKNVAPNLD